MLCLRLLTGLAGCLIIACTLCAQPIRTYECHRTVRAPHIDGNLNDGAWRNAPWTEFFIDIEGDGKAPPRFRTRVKMLWDDQYFYIAAQMEEPHVWATLTEHDSVIFHDNDFEVFIDPDGDTLNYYELEINALNTTWDLLLDKPYRLGGKADNSWSIPGMKTAVFVEGSLNQPEDQDRGWSVEMALPWKALAGYSHQPAPPLAGDTWRVNFSRVEWKTRAADGKYTVEPNTREDNWVWSPQGAVNMHIPERWGKVRFLGR